MDTTAPIGLKQAPQVQGATCGTGALAPVPFSYVSAVRAQGDEWIDAISRVNPQLGYCMIIAEGQDAHRMCQIARHRAANGVIFSIERYVMFVLPLVCGRAQ